MSASLLYLAAAYFWAAFAAGVWLAARRRGLDTGGAA
jgi:hypothetical protein